jgi:hypothetical protein
MSKHEQMLQASIHFWVLREETREHEPVHEGHCAAEEGSHRDGSAPKQ